MIYVSDKMGEGQILRGETCHLIRMEAPLRAYGSEWVNEGSER